MKKALIGVFALVALGWLVAPRVHAPDVSPGASSPPASPARSAAPPAISLGDPELERQVAAVIESMDRTGRPPAGVVQGGRGGRGVFQNAEGRLPAQPPGYYTESDVWPPGTRGRDPLRLVFGRGGEVYYSADHYRSFTRVR
jgi:guanyl-specific ribonuclease Sa